MCTFSFAPACILRTHSGSSYAPYPSYTTAAIFYFYRGWKGGGEGRNKGGCCWQRPLSLQPAGEYQFIVLPLSDFENARVALSYRLDISRDVLFCRGVVTWTVDLTVDGGVLGTGGGRRGLNVVVPHPTKPLTEVDRCITYTRHFRQLCYYFASHYYYLWVCRNLGAPHLPSSQYPSSFFSSYYRGIIGVIERTADVFTLHPTLFVYQSVESS